MARGFRATRAFGPIAAALGAVAALSTSIAAADEPTPRAGGWLVKSYAEIEPAAPARDAQNERAALKAMTARRTGEDVSRLHWWAAGGPVHRWNEIVLDELQEAFVTLPLAARHLALLHAALDDAVAAALHHRKPRGPAGSEGAGGGTSPSEYAAAAAAAADVLAYLFPARAAHFAARAEEAIRTRLIVGVESPSEAAAGRSIGRSIAALAIARGVSDGSDANCMGAVPDAPGLWTGANPIAPLAGMWAPWVLAHAGEFRPAAPPPVGSKRVEAALDELRNFARTAKSNHRAMFWEVNDSAGAHALWNEIARTKLLEHRYSTATAARILAALNVALADAGLACWDAKYAYWYARPSQLDPELEPLYQTPNHPSYPAAHGCQSTAAATVLAAAFPRDRERLLALAREAGEARIWAGIHFRFDVEVGQELGRKVAERTLERAFGARTD